MTYGDECTRSRDIDNLESKTRDLDFDVDRLRRDLEDSIARLQDQLEYLKSRVNDLEEEETNYARYGGAR